LPNNSGGSGAQVVALAGTLTLFIRFGGKATVINTTTATITAITTTMKRGIVDD